MRGDVVFLLRLAVVGSHGFADAHAADDLGKHGQPGLAVAVRFHHLIDQGITFQPEGQNRHLQRIDAQFAAGLHGAERGNVIDGEDEVDLRMDGEGVMGDLMGGGKTRFGIDGDDVLELHTCGSEPFHKAAAAILRVGLVESKIQQYDILLAFFTDVLLRPNAQVKCCLVVVHRHDGALVGDLDGLGDDGDIPLAGAVDQQAVKIRINGGGDDHIHFLEQEHILPLS